jgi:hypothetical protein
MYLSSSSSSYLDSRIEFIMFLFGCRENNVGFKANSNPFRKMFIEIIFLYFCISSSSSSYSCFCLDAEKIM